MVAAKSISRELHQNYGLRSYRPAQAKRISNIRRRKAHNVIKVTEEVENAL